MKTYIRRTRLYAWLWFTVIPIEWPWELPL